MLTMLCKYAADTGLPYEFVEWALDAYGHDADDYASIDAVARDWRESADA